MNLERLINMVVHQVMRRLIDAAINLSVSFASRRMKPKEQLSDEELRQVEAMGKMTSRPNELKEIGRRQF